MKVIYGCGENAEILLILFYGVYLETVVQAYAL